MSDSGPSSPLVPSTSVSRRAVLTGLVGTAGAAAIAGCGSSSKSAAGTPSAGATSAGATTGGAASSTASAAATSGGAAAPAGSITFGSNYSDAAPKAAFASLTGLATAATGVKIKINSTDHNTFQQNISAYLNGTPDDLFTWFAGYRMQYFAAQGLAAPIDDVWAKIGPTFNEAAKSLSKGLDGKYYFVPLYNYPWVVFYNKSVFAAKGYTVPTTWAAFLALAQKMKTDGIIPIAFADKDGWPALGTFDIINLRVNGYDYHIKLMKHQVPWTDPGVKAVFDKWAEMLPFCQTGATGRIWEDAAKALETKQAGMMFQGSNQVAANYSAANLPDLDFFPFPAIDPKWGQDYMDAPTDGFMLSKKAKNPDAAKKVLEYIGTGAAEAAFLKTDKWDVGLAEGAEPSTYNAIQTKAVKAIADCKAVSQFMDRDSDPAMANAMIALIQTWLGSPTAAATATLQKSAEAQAKTIFSS
jgi:multiple sugar transport system substrate-binding protein